MPTICWFRRDLRLADHPALLAAIAAAREDHDEVVPLFVLDPTLWSGTTGAPRRAYLAASLRALDASLDGRLVVRHGRPADALPEVARETGATSVHVTAATEPYGRRRDDAVEAALGDIPLVRTGSPYAVGPGLVRNGSGSPYQVFTPFRRAWLDHGWRDPGPAPHDVPWADVRSDGPPEAPTTDVALPAAGEDAALTRWHTFLAEDLAGYATDRDRPDLDVTSWMSVHLKHGEIHPRTMLADLATAARGADEPLAGSVATYRSELAWREFHADVLWHHPGATSRSLRAVVPDDAWVGGRAEQDAMDAWTRGVTGYPVVDAGMRQLRATGWMHNRVRMVVASFLVKDLHVRWQRGAAYFMERLLDADVSQNQLNWQWVAGTGRDAAPFFRIFNPVTQGTTFDPDGSYVRRWVPELRDVPTSAVHQPWTLGLHAPAGYPPPVVDHRHEREVALADHRRRPTG